MAAPVVSISITENDRNDYLKAANKKFGVWRNGRQESRGSWNKFGLSRSSAYSELVRNGTIVNSTKGALDVIQQNPHFKQFIIVPINAKGGVKSELLGIDEA
jgi:hypothetical protein